MEFLHHQAPRSTCSSAVRRVMDYCREHDLAAMENGQHKIDGEDFFVNIFTYSTQPSADRIWEAHREYIDVHTVIEGSELVSQSFIGDCDCGEYHPEQDYLEVAHNSNPQTQFTLCHGYFAVFYPQDAHQTGVRDVEVPSQPVRKAVFKVRIGS